MAFFTFRCCKQAAVGIFFQSDDSVIAD